MICQSLNMSYLNRTNYNFGDKKSGNAYKLVLILVIALLFGLLVYLPKGYVVKVRSKLDDLTTRSFVVISDFGSYFTALIDINDYLNVHKKYVALQQENEQLKQTILKLSYLDSENISLRKLHKFVTRKGRFVLSTYMIRESGFFGQEWRILAGSKDGIREGQVVLNNESLVGRINSVGENMATILPITDVSSGVAVLLPRSENRGIISGTYDGNLEIYLVDKDVMPQQFDVVISAGDGNFIPQGLLIGTVSHVSGSGAVIVRPAAVLNRANLISVVEY